MDDFSGRWHTTFGPMDLVQRGRRVRGVYRYRDAECTLRGRVARGRLTFTYQEPAVGGEGWFELVPYAKAFTGQYRPDDSGQWDSWDGERVGFDGLWNTTFGLLRLTEEDGHVRGCYEMGGGATLEGRHDGVELAFTYREPRARGRGRFALTDDGLAFQGEWKPRGAGGWRPWTGIRVRRQPELTWLVVLEAPWQQHLAESEYSFGGMLREFFARLHGVQVRHRFFANEAGLRKCCRDLLYIAEPVVLVVATHARPEGLTVDGQTIGVRALAEALRDARNLRLLHFSACLLLQDLTAAAPLRELSEQARLPISGYRTSVDWAASAIIEFTFLDLILARGLSPEAAARELPRLLPFAGDRGVPEAAYRPAGFTMLPAWRPARSGAKKR